MLSAKAEFLRRSQEVEEYLLYLEKLEQQTGISISLMNTMKSSALLMLYNSVESTMTGLIQDLFDHLQTKRIDFDELNSTMRTVVLTYAKRHSPSKLVVKMDSSSTNLVIASFERNSIFSGNLDCKEIRETLKTIGIQTKHPYREVALKRVKDERNDLAHGNKSFSDCGKACSSKELRDFHSKTTIVLTNAINDFQFFLDNEDYS